MNKHQEAVLEVALSYVDKGWAVLPTGKNKRPIIGNGSRGASVDIKQVVAWWIKYNSANIGIATGDISGIFVVDVDMKNGKDGWDSLVKQFGNELIVNDNDCVARTPTGGFHFVYKIPEGMEIHNAQDLLSGIDIRGEGGYIMAAPSSVMVDDEWKEYQWSKNGSEPQLPPEWVLKLLKMNVEKRGEPLDVNGILGGSSLGNRDDDIFKISCMLKGKEISIDVAKAFVEVVAERCNPPFDVMEARNKVEYVYGKYANDGQIKTSRSTK